MNQKTLVVLKPDAMKRRLVGEIISRFEKVGLSIVASKVVKVNPDLAKSHYPVTDEWLVKVGTNSLDDFKKYGFDIKEHIGTDEPKEIGKLIHHYNQEFLQSGPVLALILEGPHAVELVRKLVGHTVPILSAPGTIRGDFAGESALVATSSKRTVENLVHASGNVEEAQREIELWFGKDQI